jgi:hypothetical protein
MEVNMSELQTKIYSAGVELTRQEIETLAKVEASMREGGGQQQEIDAEVERRLEAEYQREKTEAARLANDRAQPLLVDEGERQDVGDFGGLLVDDEK